MTFARRTVTLGLAAVLALGATAASATDRFVRVHNQTSVILYSFYSSPSASKKWGPDLLVNRQIPSGHAATIDLSRQASGCIFDLRAVFIDGDELTRYNVDVCGGFDMTYSD